MSAPETPRLPGIDLEEIRVEGKVGLYNPENSDEYLLGPLIDVEKVR